MCCRPVSLALGLHVQRESYDLLERLGARRVKPELEDRFMGPATRDSLSVLGLLG